jgi:hypothetical protein
MKTQLLQSGQDRFGTLGDSYHTMYGVAIARCTILRTDRKLYGSGRDRFLTLGDLYSQYTMHGVAIARSAIFRTGRTLCGITIRPLD